MCRFLFYVPAVFPRIPARTRARRQNKRAQTSRPRSMETFQKPQRNGKSSSARFPGKDRGGHDALDGGDNHLTAEAPVVPDEHAGQSISGRTGFRRMPEIRVAGARVSPRSVHHLRLNIN